jgi:hypothetical protein
MIISNHQRFPDDNVTLARIFGAKWTNKESKIDFLTYCQKLYNLCMNHVLVSFLNLLLDYFRIMWLLYLLFFSVMCASVHLLIWMLM